MTTEVSTIIPTGIRGWWLTYPQTAGGDGRDHAWNKVVDGGKWQSRCRNALVVDPKSLTEPEDEFGRCMDCVTVLLLELGAATAEQLPDEAAAEYQRGL